MSKRLALFILSTICFFSRSLFATTEFSPTYSHPFYLGAIAGYGSTTWNGLVPPNDKQSTALLLSTPSNAKDGGGVWGWLVGYEFMPQFALELSYMHYPNAKIFFDESSLVAFENNGLTELSSSTESLSLMTKFMVFIPTTDIRIFSSVGAARVHRKDILNEAWRISPTFGVGFNFNLTEHLMAELVFNYTGGYAQSELDPSQDYVPFLYSGVAHLAYRFG